MTAHCLSSHPLIPSEGVIWRSCHFDVSPVDRLEADTEFGRITVDLPPDLACAVDKRRSEFLAGRLCATLALRAAGSNGAVHRRGRAPVWPQGFAGSISHSSARAMAVVSPSLFALGVDCETWLTPQTAAEISEMVLTEQDLAHKPPDVDPARFCTVVFSAKESLYKALSNHLDDIPDFHEASIVQSGINRLVLSFRGWRIRVDYAAGADECITLARIRTPLR
ncbi:4'-phosphopantetheinyl transferase family protein [Pseudorhodobacter aquimaris]|uniref:4'-phosphopantetheinyl transferase family protein n=1 Tax=Pseudorhodobacter aquimaris TaxID=687412 RepID=UPI00067D4BCE|nr:4'-phosphopantetheinyl transferase superfamily protein [Pseudorhodobacter aquimaris]